MKSVLRSLRVGQKIWAIVEENIAGGEAIINFNGDLVRVLNSTKQALRCGQRVRLSVTSLAPLKLALLPMLVPRSENHLDLTV